MCGIAGHLLLDGRAVETATLLRQARAVLHRGPDGRGIWAEGSLGLAHARLAIIDLTAAAAQPMHSNSERYVTTYNGEIYNYRELRKELEGHGVQFRTNSDTEVLIEGFAFWGNDVFLKLDGMFACAIWDRKDRALTLARDRFGVKPLYIARTPKAIVFGSEAKSILASRLVDFRIDPFALSEYMTFQNYFSDRTLFDGISVLPSGTYMRICNGNTQTTKYWDYHFEDADTRDPTTIANELRELFVSAVQRQTVSDVEIGSFLSGGIDSGSISAAAIKHLGRLKTFTCGFEISGASDLEQGADERTAAEAISRSLGTDQFETILKAGDMERALPNLVWHLEEPRVGQSYPNYYAAFLASRFVKVVLSGGGGDELFGGYPWRYFRAENAQDFDTYALSYFSFWQRLLNQEEHKAVCGPINETIRGYDLLEVFRERLRSKDKTPQTMSEFVNRSFLLEARTFLQGLLIVEDKLGMAHGLEARVPFLDNALVDFAMRIPVSLKVSRAAANLRIDENISGGKKEKFYSLTGDGKLIFRSAIQSLLPAEAVSAPKKGFSAPDASWFRGQSASYLRSRIMNPSAEIYQYLDYDSITGLVERHFAGFENRRLLIWSLLYLDEFLNQFGSIDHSRWDHD